MSPDRREFWISAFYTMGLVWPFLEGTPDRIRVWDAALQDLSSADLQRGVAWLVGRAEERHTPVPGALRAAVRAWRVANQAGEAPHPLMLLPPGLDRLPELPYKTPARIENRAGGR